MKMLTPKQSLNKAFLKQKTHRIGIELFKSNLTKLLNNIDEIEREENQKNHVILDLNWIWPYKLIGIHLGD